MSTRVIELRIKFLKGQALSFSLHKKHCDVPLSTCPAPDVTLTGGFGINNADTF